MFLALILCLTVCPYLKLVGNQDLCALIRFIIPGTQQCFTLGFCYILFATEIFAFKSSKLSPIEIFFKVIL